MRAYYLFFLAIFSLSLTGCGMGGDKEEPLAGDRIPLLKLTPDLKVSKDAVGVELSAAEFSNWPQVGGSSMRAPNHPKLSKDISFSKPRWVSSIGSGAGDRSPLTASPIADDGRAFTMDTKGVVRSFDTKSGSVLWSSDVRDKKIDSGGTLLGGAIAFNDGKVYVTTGAGIVVALDSSTGEELWSANISTPSRSAPTPSGDLLFVSTLDARIIALDAGDGSKIWEYQGLIPDLVLLNSPPVTAAGDIVISPLAGGEVVALRAKDGAGLWAYSASRALDRVAPTGRISDIAAPVVMSPYQDGHIYFIGSNAPIVAVDGMSGKTIWSHQMAGMQMPWISGNSLFAISSDGELVAFNSKDGKVAWTKSLPIYKDGDKKSDKIIWYGPVLASSQLIMTSSQGRVLIMNAHDSTLIMEFDLGAGVSMPPIVSEGSVYFLTNSGNLVAY